tara:strand:+ start:979 stop:1155 length:177 start_codon:yes stop_codon:yes gene_type:complete
MFAPHRCDPVCLGDLLDIPATEIEVTRGGGEFQVTTVNALDAEDQARLAQHVQDHVNV